MLLHYSVITVPAEHGKQAACDTDFTETSSGGKCYLSLDVPGKPREAGSYTFKSQTLKLIKHCLLT